MVQAVLCELEGVLADTSAARRRALRESFAEEGLILPAETFDSHCANLLIADGVRAALDALGAARDDTGVALLELRAERRFSESVSHGVTLAPGAAAFIESSLGRARLALVTRMSRRDAELMLGLAGLETAFECIVCAEDAPAPKPSPMSHRHALERLARRRALALGNVVALESDLAGIRAARSAGVRCIAVGTIAATVAAEADAVLSSLEGVTPAALGALVAHEEEVVG